MSNNGKYSKNRTRLLFAAAVLLILTQFFSQAQAGPIDCSDGEQGVWRACADAFATIGPDTSTDGAIGALGFRLLTEVVPGEKGRVRAEVPPDPVLVAGILTFNVQAGKTLDGFLRIDFPIGLTFPVSSVPGGTGPGFIRIAGGAPGAPGPYSIAFPIPVDDDYSAVAATWAYSNGDTDSQKNSDGPNTGTSATATAEASASREGQGPIENEVRLGPIWDVVGITRVSIDGGPLTEIHSYEWSRDEDGNVIANNIVTDLMSGPISPGDYTAVGFLEESFTFGPGDHAFYFEHELTGFLEDGIDGDVIPEPSMIALLAAGFLGLLVSGIRQGRWERLH